MKIAVLGGGGFIGSAVCDRLLLEGHQVKIFERLQVKPYRTFGTTEHVEWLTVDFQNAGDVSTALEGMDAVLHLVSATLPKNSNEDMVFDVQSNLVSTLRLLSAMVAARIKRIVFISSGGTVYGEPNYLPIDELHPTNPLVSYGIVKLAIEKYLLLYDRLHGIRATILRASNAYGERQRVEGAQGAVSVFLDRALTGRPIEIWGDGNVTRDFVHVRDIADAFAAALHYEGKEKVFNVSSGIGVSLNELMRLIEDLLGRKVERHYMAGRSFDAPASVLCNQLAKKELEWSPKVQLTEGIRLTAHWIQSTRKV